MSDYPEWVPDVGQRVHYIPYPGCDRSLYENGIVKSVSIKDTDYAFVVYHCAGEWDRYTEYTAARTHIDSLGEGWV